jgi:23S rRNA (pseudouridine1915-N3)-methyltransferase
MANINIVCIGRLKEKYFKEAQAEYIKRLSAFCRVSVIEKKESPLPKDASAALIGKAIEEESASIQASAKGTLIALSPGGDKMDSENFAAVIKNSIVSGDITFAIGGSYGLGPSFKKKADRVISFSDMTFPHQLFRIILLEQVYRAFMITEGRTYHK